MSKEAAFSVFCLENYKAYKSLTGKQTAELFRQYSVKFPFTMNVSVLWYYGLEFCFLFFPARLNTLDIERVSADFAVLGREGCLSASSERKLHALFHPILEAVHRYRYILCAPNYHLAVQVYGGLLVPDNK